MMGPTFSHPQYELLGGDRIRRRPDAPPPPSQSEHAEEEEAVVAELFRFVAESMLELGLEEVWVPDENHPARCPIYTTKDWEKRPRLLLVLVNQVGGQAGVWSRSLCLDHGLKAGSMLGCLERAHEEGYGVIVLNPNCNSVALPPEVAARCEQDAAESEDTRATLRKYARRRSSSSLLLDTSGARLVKVAIEGSGSPEEHALALWKSLVLDRKFAGEVYLLSYGNGSSLAKELLLSTLASEGRCQANLMGAACIEASLLVEADDALDVRSFIRERFVNWEQHTKAPAGARLVTASGKADEKLGCTSISLGRIATPGRGEAHGTNGAGEANETREENGTNGTNETNGAEGGEGVKGSEERQWLHSSAWSLTLGGGLDGAFRFFQHLRSQVDGPEPSRGGLGGLGGGVPSGERFAQLEAERLLLDPELRVCPRLSASLMGSSMSSPTATSGSDEG
eukprot:CAMPEP_0172641112 /NCGR_PEP_ID=MMETSP1068-20121228/225878_1 /TAXON_ID=35684 /ORGANISM="Pseudopedinella elastica, Strain CCMP716" /LENGTH=452 /DNA_ID=CAMNT_0013454619 /DNA_START=136 /DNA_END=1491 /DNA_ORIENTATION=-